MLKNNITNKNENKVLGFFSDDEKLFPVIQLKAKKKTTKIANKMFIITLEKIV